MTLKRQLTLLLLASSLIGATSCSSSSDSSKTPANSISPYDKEFEPEESSNADLPEAELLERAKGAYDRGLYSVARENWSTLREQYPSSYYATLAELKIADTYYYAGDYATAVTSYEEFLKLHPAHDAIPYVRFQIGNAHRDQYAGVAHDQGPLQLSLKSYRKLIEDYPRSDLVLPAREAIATCRELMAEHEAYIARFYLKQGYSQAQIKRLELIVRDYPETFAAKAAREELQQSAPTTPILLTSADSKRAVQPKGAKPATPELIASDDTSRESSFEARFRLMQPEKVTESEIPIRTESDVAKKTAPESDLNYLNCKEENGLLVFTAQFANQVDFVGRGSKDKNAFVLVERGTSLPKSKKEELKQSRLANQCEVGAAELKIFGVGNAAKTFVARLENSATKSTVHAFTLDRPSRFVVILEK